METNFSTVAGGLRALAHGQSVNEEGRNELINTANLLAGIVYNSRYHARSTARDEDVVRLRPYFFKALAVKGIPQNWDLLDRAYELMHSGGQLRTLEPQQLERIAEVFDIFYAHVSDNSL